MKNKLGIIIGLSILCIGLTSKTVLANWTTVGSLDQNISFQKTQDCHFRIYMEREAGGKKHHFNLIHTMVVGPNEIEQQHFTFYSDYSQALLLSEHVENSDDLLEYKLRFNNGADRPFNSNVLVIIDPLNPNTPQVSIKFSYSYLDNENQPFSVSNDSFNLIKENFNLEKYCDNNSNSPSIDAAYQNKNKAL